VLAGAKDFSPLRRPRREMALCPRRRAKDFSPLRWVRRLALAGALHATPLRVERAAPALLQVRRMLAMRVKQGASARNGALAGRRTDEALRPVRGRFASARGWNEPEKSYEVKHRGAIDRFVSNLPHFHVPLRLYDGKCLV